MQDYGTQVVERTVNIASRQAADIEFLGNKLAELCDTMKGIRKIEAKKLRTLGDIDRKLQHL